MKIALVTMNVKAGKCEENIAYMKSKIQAAREAQADIIVFPQNAISGYLLGDRWLEPTWCAYVDHFNQELIEESHDIAIVWGNIKYRNNRRFNAAFFAYQGMTHMRVKGNESLPYMDDVRYFENNDINSAIEYKDQVLALNFGDEVQLADFNINLDAFPYDMKKKRELHGNVIYVNACGVQNCEKNIMIMSGGSCVQLNGDILYHGGWFQEDMHIVDTKQVAAVEVKEAILLDALKHGIYEFDKQVFGGKQPWVVGLSGGLDSSVTCALLAYSLNPQRIYGYNMATRYNREITISNARKEAEALGIHYQEGVIENFVEASKTAFKEEFGHDIDACDTLVQENLQARSRGFLLSGFAAVLGGVVVNNGNKVESALGYCTLYGDSIGAISLLGDLTKTQLFTLSHEINAQYQKEVIPYSLLPEVKEAGIDWKMPPSAELKDEQFDPMKWFYHDYLVEHINFDMSITTFMEAYLHNTLDQEVVKWIRYYHLDNPKNFIEDLDWFLSTMDRNGFKRLQTPPLLSVHHKTLANQKDTQMRYDKKAYEELRNRILTMEKF